MVEGTNPDLIEPVENSCGAKNQYPLRDNVEHAEQRAVGAEEHQRPSRIQRELKKEQSDAKRRVVDFSGSRRTRHTANAIKKYRTVQTGAKIQLGGLNEGLVSSAYHGVRLGKVAS